MSVQSPPPDLSPDPTTWSMEEAGERLAHGLLSPAELTEAYLEAIAERDQGVNAYITVAAQRARADARRAGQELRSGHRRGPLHGVPVAVKDIVETAGVRTTAGSRILADNVPKRDAVIMRHLKNAGTVLLGKTNTHEYAYGGTTNNPHYGPTRNPWSRVRIPGGSSGGSAAAVAMHTAPGAVGTDTCGSVRIPAALCGCVGYKPTRGLTSLDGVLPLAPSLDHVGPISRTVPDAALMLDALTGMTVGRQALADPVTGDLRGLTVGVPTEYFFDVLDPSVAAAVRTALDRLADAGARIRPVDVGNLRPLVRAIFLRVRVEAQEVHRATFPARREDYGADLAENLGQPAPNEAERREAERIIADGVRALERVFPDVDVLATPTTPVTAPPIGADRLVVAGEDMHIEEVLTGFTSVFNAAGLPALSLPCGLADGLPVGLQIVGPPGGDAQVLRSGAAFERVRGRFPSPGPVPAE